MVVDVRRKIKSNIKNPLYFSQCFNINICLTAVIEHKVITQLD